MANLSPKPAEAALARLAVGQHGNVTTAQLNAAGLNSAAIVRRVDGARLFPVHHGVYGLGRPPVTPHERAAAAVLACGPGAALSHAGALALWDFSRRWPQRFDVIAPLDRRPRGIRVHHYQGLQRRDLTVQHGIRATSPARTILDCVRRLDQKTRTRTVNDALHSAYLTQSALADVRNRFPHHPGARLLDPYLDQTGITRSPHEDDFAAFCARHDLPRPHTNVRVAGHIVDALFPDHKLIVELDSWEFHRDRQAFENDRRRDADTLVAGYGTVRLTWERLHAAGDAAARQLRQILSERRPA